MSIADNLHRVQERIARAAERAGRDPREITLVGVTKYVDTAAAAELIAAGCTNLGESRPQELWKKHDELQRAGASPSPSANNTIVQSSPNSSTHWHLIGHLQRNKVARTLPLASLIHSVDSERLIAELNQACLDCNSTPSRVNILLEVNTSNEPTKHGLSPDDVEPLLQSLSKYPRVQVQGLMTMAALDGGPTVAAHNFATLRSLRDELQNNQSPNTVLTELSMGMSDDFEIAIQEGATIVRVGSLLWGQ